MNLDSALEVLRKAVKRQKEYETKRVESDLIIDGINYKGWCITAFKDEKIDVDFFKGWLKIRNLVDEFYKQDKTKGKNETTPNKINKKMKVEETPSGIPKIPSVVK